ncbi:MAG: VWA-like domain-containing protein [Cyanobacteria bacterium P01_E01_bin.42]
MISELERLISASVLRIRMKSPFFATLALFTHFRPSSAVLTAATDGRDIFYNPEFLGALTPPHMDGVLLHEVLHAALLHVVRRGSRDPELWNIAADIVVNGAIAEQGAFELPPGHIRNAQLEKLSVEEIYEILLADPPPWVQQGGNESGEGKKEASFRDLLDRPPGGSGEGSSEKEGSLGQAKAAKIEAHWKTALQNAATVARSSRQQGSIPGGMRRELEVLNSPQLDWRSHLWRYLVKTPNDFSGFDRRFIGRGLYLEALEGESVQVFVAVDTSGSIGDKQMQSFLSEVYGILQSYPHLKGELYYVDAEAYGPYPLNLEQIASQPIGGGGTSFIPFFKKVEESWDKQQSGVCVYLTDGYGSFPDSPPELPVLWVVTPQGLALEQFPFGETVRLLSV